MVYGKNEISVCQTLHQSGSAEAVGTMIGEVGLACGIESGDGRHQVVVDPQTAHGVMDCRIDHHRLFGRITVGDLLVHMEEVAVLPHDDIEAVAFDRIGKVQIDAELGVADALPSSQASLALRRGHVAGYQVAETRVLALQVVIAILYRNVCSLSGIANIFRYPDATVIAQTLAHQGQL